MFDALKKKIWLTTVVLGLSACMTTHHQIVQVYKSDGSRQCEGGGKTVEEMAKQLGDIKVYAAKKTSLPDVLYPAVCGGATGNVNVYTIDASQLDLAKQQGFLLWRHE